MPRKLLRKICVAGANERTEDARNSTKTRTFTVKLMCMDRTVVSFFFRSLSAFTLLLAFLFGACDQANKPIDAETRGQIDSISSVRIKEVREELDSLCREQHTTLLPGLIDSIKQKRLREIEQKLKSVPK